jgi:hypothetical protein
VGHSNVCGKKLRNVLWDKRFGGLWLNHSLDGYSLDSWLDDIMKFGMPKKPKGFPSIN